jgi:pilus assembly protein Flp/PilA
MLEYIKASLGMADSEEGATAVEYGIMVALIAVVIIGVVFALGGTLQETFSDVDSCLEDPSDTACPDPVTS